MDGTDIFRYNSRLSDVIPPRSAACRPWPRAGHLRVPLLFRLLSGPRAPNPQFFDHRPHRPWQVDTGRPFHPALRGPLRPGDERAGPGFHGPGARTRHHDQGPDRRIDLQGARRRDVRTQSDRHTGTRRLRLRGLAIAGGVRRRTAGRRCVAGRGSADRGQLLHRGGAGRDRRAGAEQDRPAVGRSRARHRRDRGHHRHRCHRRGARQRQERHRDRRDPRSGDRQDPAANGRSRGAAAGADHRFLVRQLRRRGHAGARDAGRAETAGQDPADGRRVDAHLRAGRRIHAEVGRARPAVRPETSASSSPASRKSRPPRSATRSRSPIAGRRRRFPDSRR